MSAFNPIYALLALQVLDLISTVLALRQPGVVESNPILAPLFKQFGVLPTLIVLKGALAAYVWYAQASIPVELIYIACVGYAWVVVNNFKNARG